MSQVERTLRKLGYKPDHGSKHNCWKKGAHVIRFHYGLRMKSNAENRLRRDLRRAMQNN